MPRCWGLRGVQTSPVSAFTNLFSNIYYLIGRLNSTVLTMISPHDATLNVPLACSVPLLPFSYEPVGFSQNSLGSKNTHTVDDIVPPQLFCLPLVRGEFLYEIFKIFAYFTGPGKSVSKGA